MSEEDDKIIRAMALYGGSFVKRLASAAVAADPVNLVKIKLAFPEYWEEYKKMSQQGICYRCGRKP